MFKKLYLLVFFGLLFTQNCTSQTNIDKAFLTSKAFTFEAERIVPMTNVTINTLTPAMRTSSDLLNIYGEGYGFVLEDKKMELDLPYFGRSYTATMGKSSSVREVIKEFSIKEKHTRKKTVFEVKPHRSKNISEIMIEVFKNGRAYVTINFFHKQSISYDGIITKNKKRINL